MIRVTDGAVQQFEVDHIAKVRMAAPEGTLFLKRNGRFPLAKPCKVALYGNGARHTIKGGTGSGDVNVRHFTTVEEGLTRAGFTVTTTEWLDAYDDVLTNARKEFFRTMREESKAAGVSPFMYCMGRVMAEPEYDLPLNGEGDCAIYVVARNSGEGSDRKPEDVQLTAGEKRDILALNARFENFLLVLNVGGMVDIAPVDAVENVLLLGQLGTPTGDVLADLVLGKAYPSGKLTMTWTDISDYPSTEGFSAWDDTYYREGIYVGYRYFSTIGKKVSYPFGFGLSYTDFIVKPVDVFADAKKTVVTARVQNVGSYAGKEVVQVYYTAPNRQIDQPYLSLAGFAKTKELAPGESCEVKVEFATTDLASYDTKRASYVLLEGDYVLRVGNSAENTEVAGVLTIESEVIVRKLKHICAAEQVVDAVPTYSPVRKENEDAELLAAKHVVPAFEDFQTETVSYRSASEKEEKLTEKIVWEQVKNGEKTVQEFAESLTEEELAKLCIGSYRTEIGASVIGSASSALAGAAGETTNHLTKDYGLDCLIMADGPAGIRISPVYKLVENGAIGTGPIFGEDMQELFSTEESEMFANKLPKEILDLPDYYQYCIAIPIGTELAQMFHPELVEEIGDMIGSEMEMFGVHLWLAPALNIHRSPLCGRNFEYYSEDPLVAGKVTAAITNGVQKHAGCATTIKHYACNNQERNRYANNSVISERALREIYLRGFEIGIRESAPGTLMTSYNLVNGEHTCNSRDLVTAVLRDEWGYRGVVMTDWCVTTEMLHTGAGKYHAASAAGCVEAGNDITMPGGASDLSDMMKALEDKTHPYAINRADLLDCAIRILKLILDLSNETK